MTVCEIAMAPASLLPPLPVASGITEERLAWLRERRKSDLVIPPEWRVALEAHGWLEAGANDYYVFLERPGYWLRLAKVHDEWYGSIQPEEFRVPRDELGDAGYGMRFPDEMQAPTFSGRGARARALAAAQAIWKEHEAYLAPLGILLTGVGVRQFRGSGSGGYVAPKAYRRLDVYPPEAPISL